MLRGIAWLRGLLLLSAIAVSGFADPVSADSFKTFRHTLSLEIAAGEYHMQAQLLGAIELPATTINRIPLHGLSALAFDADQNLLYAGSDGGSLFHFQPGFEDGLLTELKAITAYRLHDPQGKPLRGDWADAEGMSARNADNGVSGDTVLTISFEREHRVEDYTPNGRWIRRYPLPRQLRQKQAYTAANRSLEAITWLRNDDGVFVVAPEFPLRTANGDRPNLFASDGRYWFYPLHPHSNAAVVAMESLADGGLLVLERGYNRLLLSATAILRRTQPLGNSLRLQVRTLVEFNTATGWRIDNMEGLTRHRHDRWFVISDDNRRLFQKTLLLYLRLPGT